MNASGASTYLPNITRLSVALCPGMPSMKCYNCDKNAMFAVGPPGETQTPLCLDCYIRYQAVEQQRLDTYERQINFLTSQMEATVGLPSILPRYPERPRVIQTGAVTLNNISIANSQVGVLNTGTIENVDATVSVLNRGGAQTLANALTELVQAIIGNTELDPQNKNQSLELLNELAEQAVAPKEKRKPAVTRALLTEAAAVLGGIGAIAELWQKFQSALEAVLGG